jgi:hypothetical protein
VEFFKSRNKMSAGIAGCIIALSKRFPPPYRLDGCSLGQANQSAVIQKVMYEEIKQSLAKNISTREFCPEDFEILYNTSLSGTASYLNDTIICTLLRIVSKQFPHIQSLQSTSVYRTQGFRPIDSSKDFIQIVHAGIDHWAIFLSHKRKELTL